MNFLEKIKKLKLVNIIFLTVAGIIMIIECRNAERRFYKPILSALA